jgi:hypothetical protein
MKKLILPIVAMLVLSTTFVEAGNRHVRKVVHKTSEHIARGQFVPIYFSDRLCTSSAAPAKDAYIVCVAGRNSPHVGRDPDVNVRFELRRDWGGGS